MQRKIEELNGIGGGLGSRAVRRLGWLMAGLAVGVGVAWGPAAEQGGRGSGGWGMGEGWEEWEPGGGGEGLGSGGAGKRAGADSLSPGEAELRGGLPVRLGLQSPLNIPLVVSGNFGELRKNHFHTGIDFKTQGREGLPVLAATAGVVSRVKVSPIGYGHAVYLRSPKGITTVYAHLQRFEGELAAWVLQEQYRLQRFDIDLVPPETLRFQAGDTLGWSGNSGGSGGPHLHFEVRETATERPINPLLWDLPVTDRRPPELGGLWILPLADGQVAGRAAPFRLGPEAGEVEVEGTVRLALEALDRLDGANNVCGVYRLEMLVDGALWFAVQFDTLDFAVNRDLNAHALPDASGKVSGQTHRLHRLPGSRLPIYRPSDFLGTPLSLAPGTTRRLELRAEDVHGQRSSRVVNLVAPPAPASAAASPTPAASPALASAAAAAPSKPYARFHYGARMEHKGPRGARLGASAVAFYEDTEVPFYPLEERLWVVGTPDLLTRDALSIDVPLPADAASGPRTGQGWVAWLVDSRGKRKESFACTYHASTRQLGFRSNYCGTYRLVQDTLPPTIGPLWLTSGSKDAPMQLPAGELRWEVADAGSEVVAVEATLNGAWLMLHWDPKLDRAFYRLSDARHTPGVPAQLTVTARDQAGNRATWSGTVVLGE